MQSDDEPGTIIGSGANQANYNDAFGSTTDVGAFSGSGSFYGTFDQSGNVYQWTDGDGQYFSPRPLRGGYYVDSSDNVSSSSRVNHPLSDELSLSGFRLAS
jgi:formylglycine-generating enzyme required for sulfatase activity